LVFQAQETCLVLVDFSLEWTFLWNTQVLSLSVRQNRQLSTQVVQVTLGNGLVQDLWQQVHTNVELGVLAELWELSLEGVVLSVEQSNLSQDLVGERAGHHEGRVTSGTTQVDQSTLSQQDDVTTVQQVSVDLRLDVDNRLGVGLQPSNVNLNVEVTNVTNNGVLWHLGEVSTSDDVTATGGGDEDLTNGSNILHGSNLVTRDSSLQSVDWVNLGDNNSGTHTSQGHGTTLTNITETSDNGNLTGNHNIGGSLDTVDEGLSTSVQVVELGLGDRVVDVDGWNLQDTVLQHLVQVVNTGGGLLGQTETTLQHLWVLLVNQSGQVSTVVQDQVQLLAVLESKQLLLNTPQVLFLGLTLPSENWNTSSGNGSGGVVLGGENVTGRPGNLGTQSNQGLDQHSGLDGHVQTSSDSSTLQRLRRSVLLSDVHQTWHFVLGQLDVLSAESGEGDVGDFVVRSWGGHFVLAIIFFFLWKWAIYIGFFFPPIMQGQTRYEVSRSLYDSME